MALRHSAELLADQFFLLAHDDVTGKCRLHQRVAGLGLAGALLGELVLLRHITIRSGVVVVIDSRPPDDALTHTVLDHLVAEPQPHPVRTWLAFLAQTSGDSVASRLERAGYLTRVPSRRPWRTAARWVPVDMSAAAWPRTRLERLVANADAMTVADGTLAGLVSATGLAPEILWEARPRDRQYLDHVVSTLPSPLPELLAQTEAAVGNAVIAHRS